MGCSIDLSTGSPDPSHKRALLIDTSGAHTAASGPIPFHSDSYIMELGDFSSPEVFENPYPLYEELRAGGPFVQLAPTMLATGRYEVVNAVLANRKIGKNVMATVRGIYGEAAKIPPVFRAQEGNLLVLNPPHHTRLRSLLMKAFNARQIEGLREIIQSTVDDLIGTFRIGEAADLLKGFALPLPMQIICRLMNLPIKDTPALSEAVRKFGYVAEFRQMTGAQLNDANEATETLQAYFTNAVAERRARPGNDLISMLLSVEEGGERLTESEIVANVLLLFAAAHESTSYMLGNLLITLFRNPAQLALLRSQPELVSRAVAEGMRYDTSVQKIFRTVLEDTEIVGVPLTQGTAIVLFLGSANRDPAHYDRADEFLIERERPQRDSRILSFGDGPHYCLGARLVVYQLEIAISTVLTRLPRLTITNLESLQWMPRNSFRGVEKVMATW